MHGGELRRTARGYQRHRSVSLLPLHVAPCRRGHLAPVRAPLSTRHRVALPNAKALAHVRGEKVTSARAEGDSGDARAAAAQRRVRPRAHVPAMNHATPSRARHE